MKNKIIIGIVVTILQGHVNAQATIDDLSKQYLKSCSRLQDRAYRVCVKEKFMEDKAAYMAFKNHEDIKPKIEVEAIYLNMKRMTDAQFDEYSSKLKRNIIELQVELSNVTENWFGSNYEATFKKGRDSFISVDILKNKALKLNKKTDYYIVGEIQKVYTSWGLWKNLGITLKKNKYLEISKF